MRLRLISLLIVGLMLAMSLWARTQIGEAPFAIHFDVHGNADGFVSRDVGLFMMPAIASALALLFLALPALMPKKGSLERSSEAYSAMMIGALVLQLLVHFLLLAEAIGSTLNATTIVFVANGLLFVLLGNYLPKTRYNYIMGIRTPWTLADERVWDRTHRLAGPLFMLGGCATVLAALMLEPSLAIKIFLAGVFVPAIISIVYSWHVARQAGI